MRSTVRCLPLLQTLLKSYQTHGSCSSKFLFKITDRHFSQSSTRLADRLYSKKHEWVSVEGKIGTLGISDHAQEALGDIVYVELPDVDREVEKDEAVAALESVKAASDVYTPVSGKITEKNALVENEPGLINKSVYEKGWLFKMELKNAEELKELMDEAAYDAFLKSIAEEE